jgi:hypothetical protein
MRRLAAALVDQSLGHVTHTAQGQLSLDEIRGAFRAALENPAYRRGMTVLWDVREATIAHLSAEDLRTLARFSHELRSVRGGGRAAILVSRDADFGVARMFQLYADVFPWETMVFRDLGETIEWLGGSPALTEKSE